MTTTIDVLKLLQDYACINQSSLVEYLFLADRKHKAIQQAISLKASKEILKKNILDLEDYFQASFSEVASITYQYLEKYFSQKFCNERSAIPIRFSIKVIAYDQIVSRERFPSWAFEDIESTILENTAFEYLSREGTQEYYVCNNIPKAIESSGYKNNRIDIEKAKQYIKKSDSEKSIIEDGLVDVGWTECWKKVKHKHTGEEQIPPPESCYKSTIVVPILLHSKDLKSSEYKDFFNLGNTGKESKVILGYLCLDHPLDQYFREETDVKLVDIFSKFLSLYMLPELAYTQYSTSYFKALQVIGEF
jgi:hypothetical protein